ncbi:hypothetical protein [Psychrobacillus sp. FJAT-21963]|uniref:hypothetical protein n=1 Tax=Psychrobacillus sp. FJAT-21963 TaxID=1712028 RepID=UPI0007015E31|nr:hypothetical protein [Psychrobacillus sp. FJAT-21963]KQL33368.1 hypothetical protein AN959_17575 [Psychrobacillus sp. FJAT-21963]
MNELVIQTHNFQKAKNQLKQFSMTKAEELALKKVDVDGGLFNWFDHKVTGQELNVLTNQVQDYLIKFNTLNTKFIKEFGEVYNALEALDKEYIQAILISIKAAEKASKEAKDAQKDINKTIEMQKQTILVLKNFKDKLDKYEHLENVDEVWKDTQKSVKKLKSINTEFDSIKQNVENQANTIFYLNQFNEELSRYNHLRDIDQLWEDAQTFSKNIKLINTQIEAINNSIKIQGHEVDTLNQFKDEINKYNHLGDIDQLWEDAQTFSKNIKSINMQIEAINNSIKIQSHEVDTLNQFKDEINKYNHLGDIDQLWEDSHKSKVEVKSLYEKVEGLENHLYVAKQQMNEDKVNYESQINTLFKKTKIAYALAGGSIGIALILIMVNILGIL